MLSKYFLFVVVPLFFVATILYYIVANDAIEPDYGRKESKPTIVGKNIDGVVYNDNGSLLYNYRADYLEYFQLAEVSRFVKPKLYAYQEGSNNKAWQIVSKEALYNTDDSITLYEDVQLESYKADKLTGISYKNIQMNTQYLELDLTTKDVRSDRQVDMIDSAKSENHGKFLEGNIESNQYKLNEECHAIIQPADFEKSE